MGSDPDALLETVVEHLQSAWVALGTYSFAERYEQTWAMGTPQYHLQAAETAAKSLFQSLRVPLNVYAMYSDHLGKEADDAN